MELAGKLFKGDRSVWIIFMFLCLISLVEVYSATSTLVYRTAYYWTPIVRHASFLLAGFVGVLLLSNIPSRFFSVAIFFLPIAMILLLVTIYIGEKTNEGARWLSIFGISFQPSEIAKLTCIVFVAFMLSRQERITPNLTFWITILGVGLTCLFIFPENLSTAALLFLVCFLIMFVGQAQMKKMLILFVCLIVGLGVLYASIRYVPTETLQKYLPRLATWQGRFDDFRTDKETYKYEINDDNFQVNHAKIAIARGGLFGKLPGRSVQRDFLPQAYSDFIYAIIIEELGLIGGFVVLLLYVILMFRVAIIARRCERLFPKYLALGCGLLIVIQAFVNMAVAVNLIPVTGQPLPLISRGGTSAIITSMYFGFILSVSRFGAGMGDKDEVVTAEAPKALAEVTETDINSTTELEKTAHK